MSTESKKAGKGPPSGPHFCLWILWERAYRQRETGTSTVYNEFSNHRQRMVQLRHTKRSFESYKNNGRTLQVKIYEQPGNKIVDQWNKPFKNKGNGNQGKLDKG